VKPSQRVRDAIRALLRHLDRLAGLDQAACTDRFWLAPAAVLGGTIIAFSVIGTITAAPLYFSLPNGIVIALVMSGLTIACTSPTPDAADDPPRDDDDSPVLGSPGGPWAVVAHLGSAQPAGPRADLDAVWPAERDLVTTTKPG
jgi:hypothetical protein